MSGLRTGSLAHAHPQNCLYRQTQRIVGRRTFSVAAWRGSCSSMSILFSDTRWDTFETAINLDFLFAKAITEPSHPVILLIAEHSVFAESPPMEWFLCISGDVGSTASELILEWGRRGEARKAESGGMGFLGRGQPAASPSPPTRGFAGAL